MHRGYADSFTSGKAIDEYLEGDYLRGFEIAESTQRQSADVLTIEEGSLYPALQRMLVQGWVTADRGTIAGNRRR